ncbi:hypothetical protein [Xenorhabdus khoisanae]|uniref:hypothetical protein n=1 Tax=Xenorhabdus khoisanae TaxID=880157 RepID=UPI000A8BB815|nr:hypothetical protein [Xenorhabdus khoisanae]
MNENIRLAAPVLPQSNNQVLDKSLFQGQDIRVRISIAFPASFEAEDKITE